MSIAPLPPRIGNDKSISSIAARRRPRRRPRSLAVEALEQRVVLTATLSNFFTTEHLDINLGFVSPSAWSLSIRDDDTLASFATDDALLYAGVPSETIRPASSAFDFIGVGSGETYFRLPQSQNPNALYLGVAGYGIQAGSLDRYNPFAESKGRVSGLGRWTRVTLVDVRHVTPAGEPGAGIFSVWQSGDTGPVVFMSNFDDGIDNPNANGLDVTDGVTADDALWILSGGHTHYNYGFSEKGRYEIDVRLSGHLDDGNTTELGTPTVSDEVFTLYFSVMSVGRLEFDADVYDVAADADSAMITARRVGGSDGRLTVEFATSDGTATAGEDYTAVATTLTFEDGETERIVSIPIVPGAVAFGTRTVNLELSVPGPASIADYVAGPNGDNSSLLGRSIATLNIVADSDPGNQAPIAVDDHYVVTPGNRVRGNVLLNDSDPDGDALSASVEVGPAHGVLALSPDGSFAYTPGPAFPGRDRFTYQVDDGRGGVATAVALITLAPGRFDAVIREDHADIVFELRDDHFDVRIHADDHDHDDDHHGGLNPATTIFQVGPAAIQARPESPAFDFLGIPAGQAHWRLPQVENPELPFLGLETEEIASGVFQDDLIFVRLVSVNGPGEFAMWRSTDDGPEVLAATADGIGADDAFSIPIDTHDHVNWGFTARGEYHVELLPFGYLAETAERISGPSFTLRFVVNSTPEAGDDAYDVNENGVLIVDNPVFGVLANDFDPEGDRLTAALVSGPSNGALVFRPDGTFEYTPNPGFGGEDSFTYVVTDTRYMIVPLGTHGGFNSFALDVNNHRQVSGNSSATAGAANPLQAFFWDSGIMTNLGVVPGTGGNNFSRGFGLNDDGVVVGESDNDAPKAFRWDAGSGIVDIGTLGGATGVAHDVNGMGWIVGASNNGVALKPFLNVDGDFLELPTVLGTATSSGRAWSVNNRGMIAGVSTALVLESGGTRQQATLWIPDGDGGYLARSLGALVNPEFFSQAYAVSDSGLVVGSSIVGTVSPTSATPLYRGFLRHDGAMFDIGRLDHLTAAIHSEAKDVNDAGHFVGYVGQFHNAPTLLTGAAILGAMAGDHAALWDLNDLVDNGAGWSLRSGEGINAASDISGFGIFNDGGANRIRAFLLVPTAAIAGDLFSNVATVRINVNNVNDDPVANDDVFRVSAGNAVRGNVLFNDTDPDGDVLTAALDSGPSHGALVLNANGSFTYTPGPGFAAAGSDSFTYVASDGNGGFASATATILPAGFVDFEVVIKADTHVDIGVGFEDGEWDLHVHDEDNDEEHHHDEALLHVAREALTAREGALADAAFDFLGVAPGESFYRLPATPNPELIYLGISGEEIEPGSFVDGGVRLRLKAVNGPGHFSVWRSADEGPEPFMATFDGIDENDFLDVMEDAHAHFNFAFGAKGRYEITFEAVGVLLEDGSTTSSGDVTYYFSVDNLGLVQFVSSSLSGDEGESFEIHVQRVDGSDGPAVVSFAVIGGTAIPEDYDFPFEGEIHFEDGETHKTIVLQSNALPGLQGDRDVVVELAVPDDSPAELGVNVEIAVMILETETPLKVETVVVNGGAIQRSNIETLAVKFSRETNVAALIADGSIVDAVAVLAGDVPLTLEPARFRYDPETRILAIDLTIDGFGGGQPTMLEDGRHTLRIDAAMVSTTGRDPANRLADDDDAPGDGFHETGFHRLLGDFDGDGVVGQSDINLFMQRYGARVGDARYDFAFDLAGALGSLPDGVINMTDLVLLRRRLGRRV